MIDCVYRGGCWALIPAKSLCRAKSRLARVLTAPERAWLARAMLQDVLETLAEVKDIDGTLVVSNDDAVGIIAKHHGSRLLGDPIGDLNLAVRYGIRWLSNRGVGTVLVTPGDIPFATVKEFQAITATMRNKSLALVPAHRDGGTNMLGVRLPNQFAPQFGSDSLVRHCQEARRVGIEPTTVRLAGAGHDIDVPADLRADFPGTTGQRTRTFLTQLTNDAQRIAAHQGEGAS